MTTYESKPEDASEPAAFGAKPARAALDKLTDHELMHRLGQQDETALEVLFDRYHRTVYAICLRVLRNESDAEETLIEVFWELWTQSARFNAQRGTASTYLMMLARSRAIDHHRSRSARSRSANTASPLDVYEQNDHEEPGPAERTWLKERRQQVRQALLGLSPDQREAVEMSFFDGLSHQEIADRLHKPLGTIKTRIRLGLIRLRDALRNADGDGPS